MCGLWGELLGLVGEGAVSREARLILTVGHTPSAKWVFGKGTSCLRGGGILRAERGSHEEQITFPRRKTSSRKEHPSAPPAHAWCIEAVTRRSVGVTALSLCLCSFPKRSFQTSVAYLRSALLPHRSHPHFPPSLETDCQVAAAPSPSRARRGRAAGDRRGGGHGRGNRRLCRGRDTGAEQGRPRGLPGARELPGALRGGRRRSRSHPNRSH